MLATWFCHRSTWCFLSWDTDISSTRADSYSASCFSKSATDAFNCTKMQTLRAIPDSSVRGKSAVFDCWMVLTNNFHHIYTIKTSFDVPWVLHCWCWGLCFQQSVVQPVATELNLLQPVCLSHSAALMSSLPLDWKTKHEILMSTMSPLSPLKWVIVKPKRETNLFNNSTWVMRAFFSSATCSLCLLLDSLSACALATSASCPPGTWNQNILKNESSRGAQCQHTSYLLLELLIALFNCGFEALSPQFLSSICFPEWFFVRFSLLSQRRDGAFQIIKRHILHGQTSLRSLEKLVHQLACGILFSKPCLEA